MVSWHARTISVALCLTAAAAVAQSNGPAPQSNPSLTATANGVRDEAHARDIAMRKLDIAINLRGTVAETTITASFSSKAKEPVEGEFRLKLPAGAVITGYALDIGGRMIDGVLVDRPKAKAVYEERIRRKVDPGLAEVSADNVFSTRIFPIAPQAGRTIRVTYVSATERDGAIRLPLATNAPVEGWSIAIHAFGKSAPQVSLPTGQADFKPVADGVIAQVTGQSALAGDITIRPAPDGDVLVSRHHAGDRYVQLGGLLPAEGSPISQSLRVYWDRSRSRLDDRLGDEISLIRDYIAAARPRSIELVAFNSSGARRITVASATAAAAWLRTITYRGATGFASIAADTAVDRCLVFSDGQVTIDRATRVAPRCRVDAVTSAGDADRAWLGHLAMAGGGRSLSLDAGNRGKILADLRTAGSGVRGVEGADGQALAFVPLDMPAGQWRILARAPNSGAIVVRLSDGTAVRRMLSSEAAAFDGEGALVARDQLALLGATERRADFVDLSRRYGIASPSLSFIVLETPRDYVSADIAPPPGYPAEDRNNYAALRRDADAEAKRSRDERLDKVVAAWADEVEWWKSTYDPQKSRTGLRTRGPQNIPPPPPAPALVEPAAPPNRATPAPAAETTKSQSDTDNIVVTGSLMAGNGGGGDMSVTGARNAVGKIAIEAWQPDRPYIKAYDKAPARFDAVFAAEEKKSGSLPAFYLDTAEWLHRHGRTADAVEMVLAALDLPSANDVTLGIVADRLERYGQIDRAVELRERHAALDPNRPQPMRYLALALAHRAQLHPAGARADLARAVALLRDVALTPWASDWDGIELVSLVEANTIIPKLRALGGKPDIDPRLIRLLDVDLRVVLDWTTDDTDIDLWVDETNGERSIYSNPLTALGGQLSNDMTNGYGPEQYLLRRAPNGTYTMRANVYASDALDPNGASFMTAHVYRNYGRPNQSEEVVDIELTKDSDDNGKLIGRIVLRR